MKARENRTHVSLSRILVISRQASAFLLSSILYSFELINKSLTEQFSV